jgi:hypothetical protein
LSREEFTLGGARWGRGYAPSELTGDMGVATTPLPDPVQFLEADGTVSPEGTGQA